MNTNDTASLSVTVDAVAEGAWNISCTVADSDGLTSASAGATIYIEPRLSVTGTTDRQIVLSWPQSGVTYNAFAKTDLFSSFWTILTNVPTVSNGFNFIILPTTNSAGFFRLQGQ